MRRGLNIGWGAAAAAAALGLGILTGLRTAPAEPPAGRKAELRDNGTTVTVLRDDRPLLRYRYRENPRKAYADQLFTPGGINVLRDSPHDHVHHRALMFAVAVDGVDFWSEAAGCGFQKNREMTPELPSSGDAPRKLGVGQQLAWTAPGAAAPLALEQRSVTVTPDDAAATPGRPPVTLVTWKTVLRPPEGKDSIALTGSHYFGLGMRFVEAMDRGGRLFNASGEPGEIVRGEERLVPAKWSAYTSEVDGKPVTVAVFDHPGNPRHPAVMFTMPRPFAYLSATLDLSRRPLVVSAQRPLELVYGVAAWDGKIDATEVERCYADWAARQ